MDMYALLDKKRKGLALTDEEISHIVRGAADGSIPDYQLSAFLMAVCIRGADDGETLALTRAMADSGARLDFSDVPGPVADKHSSGGVADATTLVTAPVCTACGLKVAKMSGRALGFTGGTIDKLEAIPGMRVELSPARFREVLKACGLAVMQQSADIAPADKRLYALRDATATVESIPLIASSIMGKKLAFKTDVLVLDVKCGRGAFMKTPEDAVLLARAMVRIGRADGRAVRALVTAMDQPLGSSAGNALEVREAVRALSGQCAGTPLETLSVELSAHMLELAGTGTLEDCRARARRAIEDGSALGRLQAMVEMQGGDPRCVTPEGAECLLTARIREYLRADRAGVITHMDALKVGNAARLLGAGRATKTDAVDPAAGVVCLVREGDRVEAGQPVFELHTGEAGRLRAAKTLLKDACGIGEEAREGRPLVIGVE